MIVVKRNGLKVEYNPEKINKFLEFVCDGLDASMSDIAMNSDLLIYDGITTDNINKALRDSAESLISENNPDYAIVAGRILMSDLRKKAYGDFTPDSLLSIIKENTYLGMYTEDLLANYTEEEIEYLDTLIDHDRDFNFSISGALEWEKKYLVQNRATGTYFETPQISYMCVAMMYFLNENKLYSKEERLQYVAKAYKYLSEGVWNIPTPHLARLRTPTRAFSSCVVIKTGDSIDSISAVDMAARRYATLGAGLGIHTGDLRGKLSPIRNGAAINTGALYHAQSIERAALSCSQGGVRKGSITFHWHGLHKDFLDTVSYKNSARPDADSMKHSDHAIWINGFILHKIRNNEDIYLFDPPEVPKLWKLFYSSKLSEFAKEYNRCVADPKINKIAVPSSRYIELLVAERIGTGRVYIGFADTLNEKSTYNEDKYPIFSSNLCMEIALPTADLEFKYDSTTEKYDIDGLIALCNLGGINWGAVNSPDDFYDIADVMMNAIDNILSYQEHPFGAAKRHNNLFRPIGLGITGFAYWLAKNNLSYNNNYELTDYWMQTYSHAVIKASIELAKKRGPCEGWTDTKWAECILPLDIRKPALEDIIPHKEYYDWDKIRNEVKKYGVRNASMIALFPAETSAKISGSGTTNGIEPVRALIQSKGGKETVAKFTVPELIRLKDKYDIVWDWKNNEGYIKTVAVLQKYTDQAISANTYTNRKNFSNDKVPVTSIINELYLAYAYGLKTLYYNNNQDTMDVSLYNGDSQTKAEVVEPVASQEEEHCESCSL